MKCKIRWIDSRGKTTEDRNIAVILAVSTIQYDDGSKESIRKFPCCAVHMETLVGLIGRGKMRSVYYTSEWTMEGLEQ